MVLAACGHPVLEEPLGKRKKWGRAA
jgi:hypothetical protein